MANKHIEEAKEFFTKAIWSQDVAEAGFMRRACSNTSKVCIIAVRRFLDDKVMRRAADLTYSTLFALVPILALIFAIARGFGFENIVNGLLKNGIIGQNDVVDTIMEFIDSYLEFTHSGLFVGVGLIILLWSVFALANGIEINVNMIWQVKKSRNVSRKITDYFSLLLLIPFAIICLSGLSVLATGIMIRMQSYQLLGGFVKFLINAMPYLIAGLIFTGFYMFMPNTKVKFKYAVIPGFLTGIIFQLFQNLYFHGQLTLSSYNAIYGGFAALPLFLLWCNISWSIVLFGCELSYVSQNNDNFNYFAEPERFSRYHEDFYALMVLANVADRFNNEEKPMTVQELSKQLHVPIRTIRQSVYSLIDAGLLETVVSNECPDEPRISPAFDTKSMTVGKALDRLNSSGYSKFDWSDTDTVLYRNLKKLEENRATASGPIWDTPISDLN